MNQYFVVGAFNCATCRECVSFDKLLGYYLPADAHEVSNIKVNCSNGHETELKVTANVFGATATFSENDTPVQVAVKFQTLRSYMGTNLQNLIFEEAQNGLRKLIEDLVHKRDSMLHRMYLMQCVANFEVFVSDTIQGLAVRNPDVRVAMINNLKDLKDKKVKLSEFAANPQMATDLLLEDLSKASFQNVEALVRYLVPALDKDLVPTGDDRRFLEQMFDARHDCVHRNGRTKTGEPIQDPLPHLERLILLFQDISLSIQRRVSFLDWKYAKSQVGAMLDRYRQLIATLPRIPDGRALADVVPFEPEVLTQLEQRFKTPEEFDIREDLVEIWHDVVQFDECTASNLRRVVEVGDTVPDNWLRVLVLAKEISTEMLRAVAWGVNRKN